MLFGDNLLFLCISLISIPIALVLALVLSVRLVMDKRQSLIPVLDRSLTVSALALFQVGTWLYALANGSLWQGWLISALCAGSFLLSVIVVWRHSGTQTQRLLMSAFAACMAILSVYVFFTFNAEAHTKQIEAHNKAAAIRWQAKQQVK